MVGRNPFFALRATKDRRGAKKDAKRVVVCGGGERWGVFSAREWPEFRQAASEDLESLNKGVEIGKWGPRFVV